jgi:hypothetical protein
MSNATGFEQESRKRAVLFLDNFEAKRSDPQGWRLVKGILGPVCPRRDSSLPRSARKGAFGDGIQHH